MTFGKPAGRPSMSPSSLNARLVYAVTSAMFGGCSEESSGIYNRRMFELVNAIAPGNRKAAGFSLLPMGVKTWAPVGQTPNFEFCSRLIISRPSVP